MIFYSIGLCKNFLKGGQGQFSCAAFYGVFYSALFRPRRLEGGRGKPLGVGGPQELGEALLQQAVAGGPQGHSVQDQVVKGSW